MGYYEKTSDRPLVSDERGKTPDDWFNELIFGNEENGVDALFHLIESKAETHLLAALHSPRDPVMESAAYGLMECWISECGYMAREDLQRGLFALEQGEINIAERVFVNLIHAHPDWAEPIHQLATLRYMQGLSLESMRLHRSAIRLKPHHFGAWHGLALNAVELQDWNIARDAAQRALAIRPNCTAATTILERSITELVQIDP